MRFIDLALKDLTQTFREKQALLFLVIMPVVFTVFMGFAFRGAGSNSDPRLPLGWINHNPSGLAAKKLQETLAQSDVVRLVELDENTQSADVDDQVRSGKLAGALVIPDNFSQNVLTGKFVRLNLVIDEMSTNGQSVLQVMRVSLTRLMSSVEIADLTVKSLDSKSDAEHTSAFKDAVVAWQKSNQNGLSFTAQKAEGALSGSNILAENPYKQTSPGILVQFAIFGLVTSATILVTERKSGTLQRLVTTSLSKAEIIAGHMLAMLAIVLMQEVLLICFGQLLLKVDYFREPLAVLLVMLGLGLWVSALGLLIGVVAKGEEQVVLFSMIAMFVFSGLGGTWFPLETSGAGFAAVGHLMPSAWAMQGFQNILVRGQDLNSVLVPTGILVLFAAVFFGAALWRFRMD